MKQYCIYRVTPPGYKHIHVVDELMIGLSGAFKQLDMNVPVVFSLDDIGTRVPIVLLPHLLGEEVNKLPSKAILFNLEQIGEAVSFVNEQYLNTLRRFEVWDYDALILEQLRLKGIKNTKLCEIGYSPELRQIKSTNPKDIDIFFYGSVNERRHTILQGLANQGLRVVATSSLYGSERDDCIARAKVVINIHFYKTQVFEIVRLSYLFANEVCVLSEYSAGLSTNQRLAMKEVLYTELINAGVELVQDVTKRLAIAQAGFDYFSKRKQEVFLAKALIKA